MHVFYKYRDQVRNIHGFVKNARNPRFRSLLFLDIVGKRCYQESFKRGLDYLDALECFDAIDARHSEVNQGKVKIVLAREFNGIVTITCSDDINILPC